MLILWETFLLGLLACLGTNVDNLLLVLACGSAGRARLDAALLALVLAVVVGLALLLSLGADLAMPGMIAWVGLVPLAMGIYEAWPRPRAERADTRSVLPTSALALTLATNSVDTLLVQAALFADLSEGYHLPALLGSLTTAGLLAALAYVLLSHRGAGSRLLAYASRARPLILIAVGLLLLMDTGFDVQ